MKSYVHILILILCAIVGACRGSGADSSVRMDAKVVYEQALAAFDADSVRAGEQLLNEAIRRARSEHDNHTLYLAQLRLAESLAWGNSAEALAMAKQALSSYERHPDSPRNLIILLDYIGTYASQVAFNGDENFDEALEYTSRAHDLAVASQDTLGTELVSQTLTSLANIHWAMDDNDEALRYAREAVACAPEHLLLGAQQVLARCLMSCDSLAAAEAVYRSMQPGDDLQASYIVQSNLAKLALHRNDRERAEEAIDEAFGHAEDLYFKALQQKDDYYQNALLQERENERLRYSAALHRQAFWGGMAFIVFLAVVTVLWLRTRMQAQAQLHQQQAEAQMEQLKQRDGAVSFLQNFILERSEVLQKLDESHERHVVLTPHEWGEVERTLNAIDGNRFQILRERYAALKEEDIRLCILTRLRLTNRAIGNIYGVSISAVQHRKLKLKKEIFGEDDPDIPFEQVLDRL